MDTNRTTAGTAYALVDGREWHAEQRHGGGGGGGGSTSSSRSGANAHVDANDHPVNNTTDEQDGYASYLNSISLPLPQNQSPNYVDQHANQHANQSNHQNVLKLTTPAQWYEYYSVRYPTYHHLERVHTRHEVEYLDDHHEQRGIAGSVQAGGGNDGGRGGGVGGWLRRLFLGPPSPTSSTQQLTLPSPATDKGANLDGDNEHAHEDIANEESNMNQCHYQLDTSAILPEVQSFHSFHLVSEMRCGGTFGASASSGSGGGNSRPHSCHNVLLPIRPCVNYQVGDAQKGEGEKTRHYFIVGYGQIAEFDTFDDNGAANMSSVDGKNQQHETNTIENGISGMEGATVSLTSDHRQILSLIHDNGNVSNNPASAMHDIRHARGTSIGNDCIIISWGIRGDGWLVVYRRVRSELRKSGGQYGGATRPMRIGWELVAAASPSGAVVHTALSDMPPLPHLPSSSGGDDGSESAPSVDESDESEERRQLRLHELGSLFVTDLVPVMMTSQTSSSSSTTTTTSTESSSSRPVTLAISRLGGFVELLPLPPWTWEARASTASSGQHGQRTRQRRGHEDEIALPNLTAATPTTAFTTHNHHGDVTALDVYCASGDGGENDIILAACGAHSGGEDVTAKSAISLWKVTVVQHRARDETGTNVDPRNAVENDNGDTLCEVRVQPLGHAALSDVGGDVSTFLSGRSVDCWSSLSSSSNAATKATESNSDGTDNGSSLERKRAFAAATLLPTSSCVTTTSAPITTLRFTPSNARNGKSRVLLALLDYNGGVSVLDCTERIQFCEGGGHDVDNEHDAHPTSRGINLVSNRESMMSIQRGNAKRTKRMARARQIEWWAGGDGKSFSLVTHGTLTSRCRRNARRLKPTSVIRLQQWSSAASKEGGGGGAEMTTKDHPSDVCCIPMVASHGAMLLPPPVLSHRRLHHGTLPLLRISSSASCNDVDNTKPTSDAPSIHHAHQLAMCGIRQSDPANVIATLLRRGRPREAIDVARNFGGAGHFGGEVMNECHVRLWEDGRDIEALKLVTDDGYVISQVMRLLRCGDGCDIERFELIDLLDVFNEGLSRCERSDNEGVSCQLRSAIRRLGTFRLLLDRYVTRSNDEGSSCTTPYTRRFLGTFQQMTVQSLAICAATRGEIDTLTVLLARHPVDSIRERMRILDCIPFEVDIDTYEHLLPCYVGDEDGRKCDRYLLPRSSGCNAGFLTPLQFFTYLNELQYEGRGLNSRYGMPVLDVCTGDSDREIIIRQFNESANNSSNDETNEVLLDNVSQDEVAVWYLKRAIDLHNGTGQVVLVKNICAAGLRRSGPVSFTGAGRACEMSDFENMDKTGQRIVYLYAAASLLHGILGDKTRETLPSHESTTAGKNLFVSIIDLCSMDLSEATSFILESNDALSVSMFQKHVASFVEGGRLLEPTGVPATNSTKSTEFANRLETDMMDLCVEQIKQLSPVGKTDALKGQSQNISSRLEESLSVCLAFASLILPGSLSTSHLRQSSDRLVEFIGRIIYSALEVTKGEWMLITEIVIDKLWSIFELLPSTQCGESEPSSVNLGRVLLFKLMSLQLCCKWRGRENEVPRALWNFLLACSDGHGVNSCDDQLTGDFCSVGRMLISIMCDGLCEYAKCGCDQDQRDEEEEIDLVLGFISDIDEFDKQFYSSGIQQSGCLGKYLLSPLLSQHSFAVFKTVLKIRPGWFCGNILRSVVLSFIRESYSVQNNDVNIATLCREMLGSVFPDLSPEFDRHQCIYDAKQFMAEAMKLDQVLLCELLSATDLTASPVILVYSLIEANPHSILLGCEFWNDEQSASNACADACQYFMSQLRASLNQVSSDEESTPVLPPMPGALVMQLANIIGLYTPPDLLLVKRIMVMGALKIGLGQAAAAIVLSMLCDVAFLRGEVASSDEKWTNQNKNESFVLECVVAIATDKSFGNVQMKIDMCTVALRLVTNKDSPLFHRLLNSMKDLEYSLLELELDCFPPDCNQSGNNFYERSLIGVLSDIKKSSQVDVLHLMFLSREPNSSNQANLKGISEAILRCVTTSKMFEARNGSASLVLPAAKILMWIRFAHSCLLELQLHDAALPIIMQALENIKASKAGLDDDNTKSVYQAHSKQPDMTLVQRLNDRGYGWNAARRAVMMTNNEGYSEALSWAVSHFQDEDFDSPIYFLFDSSVVHVDQRLNEMTSRLLHLVQRSINDKKKTQAAAETRSVRAKANRNHLRVSKIPSPSPTNKNRGGVALKKPFVSKLPSPLSSTRPRIPPLSQNSAETPKSNIGQALPPNSADSISSGSLGSRTSVKKRIQRGKVKLGTQKLSLDERKKLAMEGKRLLDAARAKQKSVIAPPTTVTTRARRSPALS